ncbi:murein hydrolase activator NlpD [Candidatus Erwinia haradaeae]|uniref:Murein hydrolase activator NlpD n=1 Tax=Candidatus Erwinia haradaeae TaxID=1922217 RepID=A0A451D3F6_9GAMM|nr:murein hydrolase activator NlpD [Candidatus Erwinia haradaeae]VFP80197.1 Murein hydrolase activator NlpD [Candidatus Erwinia haradaeae]
MKLHCIATLALGVFSLISCSSNNYTKAPVSIINNHISKKIISNSPYIRKISNTHIDHMIHTKPVDKSSQEKNIQTQHEIKYLITQNNSILHLHSYDNFSKNSYKGKTYIVQKGDTLFYIAWISANQVDNLAKYNHITKPYLLAVGQKLQVPHSTLPLLSMKNMAAIHDKIHKDYSDFLIVNHKINTEKSIRKISKTHSKMFYSIHNNDEFQEDFKTIKIKKLTNKNKINHIFNKSNPIQIWCWPSNGKIINYFSTSERGNKGIDIEGNYGHAIVAAANGRVVYTGNALRGYGNLIIIKHKNNYLSAYAHNAKILVQENQEVKLGQKISTMGNSGTISVRLHFEIRYKGESVNPLLYLPKK